MAEVRYEVEPHRRRARTGRTAQGAATFVPDLALAEEQEYDRARPAVSRYPISVQAFLQLKQEAPTAPTPSKATARVIRDRVRRQQPEVASRAPAAVAPALEPALAPAALTNFAGITATTWRPPDCTLAAGPQHVMIAVNSTVAVHAKADGAQLLQRTLTAWFSNVVSQAKIFDPRALYDQHAGRWVLVAVALDSNANQSWFLLSVSQSADPLGPWFNYALDAGLDGTTATNNWADYPGVAVDNQAVYLTANMFRFGGPFQYAKIRVVPKSGPYSGGTVTFKDLVRMNNADGSAVFTIQPCHTFGAPQVEYLVNSVYPASAGAMPTELSLWSLTDPLGTPTLTRQSVTTAAFGQPPDAAQGGGGTDLDTGDVRILNAVFRGGSVWTALTSRHDWGDGVNVAVAHWFQINPVSGALVQQGIYGGRARHYFYPAVMPDSNGNMTMVFSQSGGSEFAAVRYSGRASTDPLGDLQPSELLKAGVANYLGLDSGGRNRWGDYAGIASDPVDGRVVWFYSELADAGNRWATWVGSARF